MSHAMPCHAMPCHAMPCHAMPCQTIENYRVCISRLNESFERNSRLCAVGQNYFVSWHSSGEHRWFTVYLKDI